MYWYKRPTGEARTAVPDQHEFRLRYCVKRQDHKRRRISTKYESRVSILGLEVTVPNMVCSVE